jgi:hypothetical protein
VRAYVRTYVRTYVHTYILTYVHTYIRTNNLLEAGPDDLRGVGGDGGEELGGRGRDARLLRREVLLQ